ncbi:MAG: toxin Fic [Myxococcales bacterium]
MRKPDRAGRYLRQSTGYRAFHPSPLPPDPPVFRDAELDDLHFKATLALGKLDGAAETLPNPDLFVFMYVRKEAVLSSQIEGTQASLIDVVEFEAGRRRPDGPKDVAEVVNYVRAMNHGLARLQALPVSLRLIREIHRELLQDVRGHERSPGEFRTSQNWIGPAGCTLQTASFVPPPPHEVQGLLGDLEQFIHAPDPMPALLKVGLVHAQFETIHPFLDGNGRVGRLLITFLLCEQGVLSRPLLYLSYFFKQHRADYYRLLQAVRDEGDWESWLKFFLRGVAQVATEATTKARRIAALREDHRSRISSELGRAAGNGLALHEHLFERPIVAVGDVARLTGVTFATANRLVDRLSALGVLTETTGNQRNRVFAYTPYLEQFSDDQTGTPLPPADVNG